jgi:rhamnogalacturonan hydrolase
MIGNTATTFLSILFLLSLLASGVFGNLLAERAVGISKTAAARSKVCNVLSYGAKADGKTDIGPAITKAFNSCAKAGGATILVPAGQYSSESSCSV